LLHLYKIIHYFTDAKGFREVKPVKKTAKGKWPTSGISAGNWQGLGKGVGRF